MDPRSKALLIQVQIDLVDVVQLLQADRLLKVGLE
jgi:hypothetical protein